MSQDPNYVEPLEEAPLSHYIQRTDQYGRPINIPVIDVRDGLAERMLAESILKATRRSKYITYNQYHMPRKQS